MQTYLLTVSFSVEITMVYAKKRHRKHTVRTYGGGCMVNTTPRMLYPREIDPVLISQEPWVDLADGLDR
jgi:hypothetical protein